MERMGIKQFYDEMGMLERVVETDGCKYEIDGMCMNSKYLYQFGKRCGYVERGCEEK